MNKKDLQTNLESTIQDLNDKHNIDADIKVSVYDIQDKSDVDVDGDKIGWAASIIKLPIMITLLEEIEKGNLTSNTKLEVDHKFALQPQDPITQLPQGTKVPVNQLLHYMIVYSDNEATNMLADKISIPTINDSMWNLGMKKSMLGHLLGFDKPRYSRKFNPDGSNITCTNDMNTSLRHIYDDSFSKLSPYVRRKSDATMSYTTPELLNKGYFGTGHLIKAKTGIIYNPQDGADVHEVGIIDDNLIVSVMLNKINKNNNNKIPTNRPIHLAYKNI
ncbi:MAG: class A beta-lactamase-related serine hydrolase, partial [Nanoarchaeota archaeon]|nr:class A beta-lactamase-related serine hydrolase [Nanoarchaeota archaeon]